MTTGKRLRRLSELGDIHMGRQIDIDGLRGTLVGLLPVGQRVIVAMVVGGRHAFTDALPADMCVEIWKEKT